MPFGFDLQNSPAEFDRLEGGGRPVVLLSTSGTGLVTEAAGAEAIYVACLRNLRSQIGAVRRGHERVAVIGAGTRGEFREEDELCCAWIADGLLSAGFDADARTLDSVERWRGAAVESIAAGKSADYLRTSRQELDLQFVLSHVDDLAAVFSIAPDGHVVTTADGDRA
jgi:2-phosphosulfolactate phosphatase